jgi:diguanylate cyclase (GGDEF)-like protein/PAS domain S-box-containing protein
MRGTLGFMAKDDAMPQIVLLVHRDATIAKTVQHSLSRRVDDCFTVDWVTSCAGATDRLTRDRTGRISAVLVNLDLEDSGGLATFESLSITSPETPILVLARLDQETLAKIAVQRGAQDYVLEDDLQSYWLPKAVRSMIERTSYAEALFAATERAQVTLNSIGDAVISTDVVGTVTFLNPVAQSLTGWPAAEAVGRPIDEVLRIVDVAHGRRIVRPMTLAVEANLVALLPASCKLLRRDNFEFAIHDSSAPIHDRRGRVTGAVMVFRDATQADAVLDKMSHLAQHDYLTDLPNRLLLNDRLSQAICTARREQQKVAVLFLDVDRFKHVNESVGHPVGDKLLLSIASRLTAGVRKSDTVSRQGGDEFVILLASIAHAADAALSARKLITSAAQSHSIEHLELQITVSIGISIYPDDGADAETLTRNAEIALLQAKDSGRNTFQFFKRSMSVRALERQSMESGLRHALERQELRLHYQAKVDLITERLTGAEALIRWQHPQRDLVSPKDFIPIAEQSGFIVPIGRWVLREACMQIRLWREAKLMHVPLAVNISAIELRSKHFVEQVREIIEDTGVGYPQLEFELTETALMQNPKSTIAVLRALRNMGIRLTLDDFGTGFSSLSYLRRFPIDALKIDRSFVRGVCRNADDATIVSAVINLGRSFHLNVIAEGIETREQFEALQMAHCAEGQGFYFQRPVGAEEFTKLLGSDLANTVAA